MVDAAGSRAARPRTDAQGPRPAHSGNIQAVAISSLDRRNQGSFDPTQSGLGPDQQPHHVLELRLRELPGSVLICSLCGLVHRHSPIEHLASLDHRSIHGSYR